MLIYNHNLILRHSRLLVTGIKPLYYEYLITVLPYRGLIFTLSSSIQHRHSYKHTPYQKTLYGNNIHTVDIIITTSLTQSHHDDNCKQQNR